MTYNSRNATLSTHGYYFLQMSDETKLPLERIMDRTHIVAEVPHVSRNCSHRQTRHLLISQVMFSGSYCTDLGVDSMNLNVAVAMYASLYPSALYASSYGLLFYWV